MTRVMSVAYTQIRRGNREKKTMLAQKKKKKNSSKAVMVKTAWKW